MTRRLPAKASAFCVRDDIAICEPAYVVAVATIIRQWVISAYRTDIVAQGVPEKARRLYEYLAGAEFRASFDEIQDCADQLAAQDETERSQHERSWETRRNSTDSYAQHTCGSRPSSRPRWRRRLPRRPRRRSGHPSARRATRSVGRDLLTGGGLDQHAPIGPSRRQASSSQHLIPIPGAPFACASRWQHSQSACRCTGSSVSARPVAETGSRWWTCRACCPHRSIPGGVNQECFRALAEACPGCRA